MKQFLGIFFLLVVVAACKQKSSNDSSFQTLLDTPQLWVNYNAKVTSKAKKILLVSGDEEYRSEEALPQLAKILSEHHGFNCTVLFAQDPDSPGIIDPNYRFNIPGLQLLKEADLVIWFTRFRELPPNQIQHLEDYLKAGKPVLGIRTATHAFNIENKDHPFVHYSWNYQGEKEDWHLGFGKRILGETWYMHHGDHKQQSTRGVFSRVEASHPILNGIDSGDIWGATDVYGIRTPISENARVLVYGQSIERAGDFDENDLFYGMRETDSLLAKLSGPDNNRYDPNKEMPPIAWLNQYQLPDESQGHSFTSTIGSSTDMLDDEVRRLLVNASYHLLDLEVPELADISLVGEYNPNQFGFHDDAHWENLKLKVADFVEE